MRKVILALVLTLSACGGLGPPDDHFTTTGFLPDEIAAVELAASEWCAHGLCATFTGGPSEIQLVPLVLGDPGKYGEHWVSRDYTRSRIEIRVLDERPDWLNHLRKVTLHELGHHFGCDNHGPVGSVMTKFLEDAPEHLTEYDLTCVGLQPE